MKNLILLTFLSIFSVTVRAEQAFYDYPAPTTFSATATSALALAQDTYRRVLIIQNNGSASVHVKFGAAHSGTEGITIAANGLIQLEKAPINSVYIRSATGTQSVTLQVGK